MENSPQTKPETGSGTTPPDAMQDGTLRLLRKYQIPVTRENYLNLAFAGEPPEVLDGEIEASRPTDLQLNWDSVR